MIKKRRMKMKKIDWFGDSKKKKPEPYLPINSKMPDLQPGAFLNSIIKTLKGEKR